MTVRRTVSAPILALGCTAVSRWDVGLRSPVVASSWGRQLKLQSADDPRLMQFILAFSGRGPESAPC